MVGIGKIGGPNEHEQGLAQNISVSDFFMLLGGFYDRLTTETRTLILPLLIFITATLVISRLRQLQHEMRMPKSPLWKFLPSN